MINRILVLITGVLSLILVVISSKSNTTFFNTIIKEKDIVIKDPNSAETETLNLEDYVIGVVAAEMPASFNMEALKAQAIASRTYATYKMLNNTSDYDVVTGVSNQSYITITEMKEKWKNEFDKYYNKIKEAVNLTKGKVMTYNDEVIEAYYFAMSNGYTEEVSLVFNEKRDYLQSVQTIYDNNNIKNFEFTKTFTKEEVCSLLNIKCDILSFTNIKRSATNRVLSINVNGVEFKGTDFRTKLSLRSTDFDIKTDNDKVIITTRGYGHGVGMSQYGANGMAEAGYTYDEILKYFYKNIEISSI